MSVNVISLLRGIASAHTLIYKNGSSLYHIVPDEKMAFAAMFVSCDSFLSLTTADWTGMDLRRRRPMIWANLIL